VDVLNANKRTGCSGLIGVKQAVKLGGVNFAALDF